MSVDASNGRARRASIALIALAAFAALFGAAQSANAQSGDPLAARGLGASSARMMAAAAVPPGFTESVAWSGLNNPTSIRFAPDGRVFILEKGGRVLVYDNTSDTTPTVYADLSTNTHDFWDRGMLGLALDPQFSSGRPFVYVLYAYNKAPNSTQVPRWPDGCPTPPGAQADGCVVTGRLSRLAPNGAETVLIEDFCQQYPSHSVGSLAFGADGALYVSAGDGASFDFADYGQDGNPLNPCGDPPTGAGGTQTTPTAEGGALRSQDIRTTADSTGLDGAILRVNPDTGEALPDNPNAGSSDPNARRIVAYGLRNPFRITVRPGTSEVWAGDVGWNTWEEINRVQNPTGPMRNFGWPCYEGNDRQTSYENLNLNLCETLYSQGTSAIAAPYYTYNHGARVVTGESCPSGGSSISGLAFYEGGSFGPEYQGALFFADYSRNCIWAMMRGSNGLPDPNNRVTFAPGAAGPVDIQIGPGGDLYYANMEGGTIRRIRGSNSNQAPTAVASANPTSGGAPLTVNFSGTSSSDPNPGDSLAYAWDLDGDGDFEDSTSATPSRTYTTPGPVTVRLRVTDNGGLTDIDTVAISVGTPPTATIGSPAAGTTWKVGDTLSFSGSAQNSSGVALPASALSWQLNLEHCNRSNSTCHTHVVQQWQGVTGGSFVAPDHEYPSYLELRLTATDGAGLSSTVTRRLDPQTVPLTIESDPAGIDISMGSESGTTPFTRDVILGSRNAVTAPTPVTLGGSTYVFSSWSDGGARTHDVTAGPGGTTVRATYALATNVKLAGADVVGTNVSGADPGTAEVYRTTATADGTATSLRLRLASDSTTNALVLGLYAANASGQPTTLLASGRLNNPQAGAWNEVPVSGGSLTAGSTYWISLLNPDDATGTLRWHDRAGATGGGEQTSLDRNLLTLPTTWVKDRDWSDGPVSGYVMGTPPGPPPPPVLSVTPASLSFGGTAGGANPASKTLAVANTGGGSLSFTASDDASWLSVSPASGSAPSTLTVSVNTAGLSAGTHTATVTVASSGVSGSPKQIPVTLTLDPPVPVLSVSPASLSFGAVAGGASPVSKDLTVSNTGAGTLNYTVSDNAAWLSVSPASGTAPGTVSVSVNVAGLAAGTYSGSVTVTSSGATGSPATIPVTFTVDPPPSLSVTPSSLSFTGSVGGANPAAKTLSVANTGGGTLNYTTSDDASWLAVTPASGTAPGTLSVSVNTAGLAQGTYNGAVTVTASGAGGSPATIPVTFTVSNLPPPNPGLVGAWGFDEASGNALDSSGLGNVGTLSGATRTTGRYGGGLQFDGVNDWVTVADANSLDLTTAMTLEGWVRPAALGTVWRTVVIKEQPGQLVYALYAGTDTASRPSGHVFTTSDRGMLGPSALPLNTWSHLAMTWDGLVMRMYVNGTQVSTSALTGTARTSTSPLRIGGNAVWPEWFNGVIDEVRVYNRALSAAEVASDRDTAVGGAVAASAAVRRAAQTNAAKAKAKAKKAKKAKRRAKPRKTQKKVHRGTRWLKSSRR